MSDQRAPEEWEQVYRDAGYEWCRPCAEYHRPPECAIDESGHALASCGCRWSDLDVGHRDDCPTSQEEGSSTRG